MAVRERTKHKGAKLIEMRMLLEKSRKYLLRVANIFYSAVDQRVE